MRDMEEVATFESGAKKLLETIRLVENWGQLKGITDPTTQTVKLLEEAGEVAHEISRGRYDSAELKDAIGDTTVVLVILADLCGLSLEDCLNAAYNEIKNRKGKIIHGGFVKDE